MNTSELLAFVVVATRGRPAETYNLLESLSKQTKPAEHIVVVGTSPFDIAGLEKHPTFVGGKVSSTISAPGLTTQRNVGLDMVADLVAGRLDRKWFVVFFDDDFRPGRDWLLNCSTSFSERARLVGIGGAVLADGVTRQGITEEQAEWYLSGRLKNEPHVWSGDSAREVQSLYGCNMAFRGSWASRERFDEKLPLYGWQEDVDYSSRARNVGQLMYIPSCSGVHLGVTGGRTSGVRFGYSQISNPIYLLMKRTMSLRHVSTLMIRNLLSNIYNSLIKNDQKDFRGRLKGNLWAVADLFRRKCHPMRVLEL